jgi:hypothetical protein
VVTSLSQPTPELLYRELYCARGQDENFLKLVIAVRLTFKNCTKTILSF